MRGLAKKFLGKYLTTPEPEREEDRFDRIQVATCVVLLEIAQTDDEISPAERKTILTILKRDFQLPSEAAEELMEIAQTSREESVGLQEYTQSINENYSREERMRIMESLWKVIYADEGLNRHEDYLIHRLAKLLRLHHEEMIEAKLRVLHGKGAG
jgi:uncharacterized tellurite resistance protein B-like protein